LDKNNKELDKEFQMRKRHYNLIEKFNKMIKDNEISISYLHDGAKEYQKELNEIMRNLRGTIIEEVYDNVENEAISFQK
jgi:hypothetical protein